MSASTDLQETIRKNIEHIRSVVQNCSTESVIGYSMVKLLDRFPQSELSSPAKQIRLLLGIMLEAEEPPAPKEFTDQEWNKIVEPLEALSYAYLQLYLPAADRTAEHSEDWSRIQQVAMSAFLSYHENRLLASTEQVSDRIRSYLSPFDDQLSRTLGISASDALTIALCIGQQFQAQLDRVNQRSPTQSTVAEPDVEVVRAVNRLGKTRLSELVKQFGATGQAFWDLFTVRRGEGPLINYPTERSIVEIQPWICISNDEAMLFNFNILLSAILLRGEEALSGHPIRDKYFQHRDKTLEDHATAVFRRILGAQSKIYRNVFETPDNHYEHDLVIFTSDICLFVEAKASPMDEPFRDPEKAFVRLQRAFRSESGIQKAYEQSLRLYKKLRDEDLVLFDAKGAVSLCLPSSISDNVFCVCVTRDSFGPLATFLSPLLSKSVHDPRVRVVNILDLEQIADAWEYFRWDGRQLKSFLSQRILLHENVVSDDELDYVGAYIRHCGLHHFARDDYDHVQLDPTYANVFDEIYFHVHHKEPRVTINPTYPVLTDFRESLKAGKSVSADVPQGPIVVGRNELCPCGSTVKFKRCHGR